MLVAALMLTACGSSIKSEPVVRTVLVNPVVPEAAKVPCDAPVTLPERDLKPSEVTRFWGRDRTSLKQCELRRRAAVSGFGNAG
jgi:hypothetical protein